MPKITTVDKLTARLYKLFSIRLRSVKEIHDYFKAKNYNLKIKGKEQISTSLINSVIQKLKEQKLLDDQEFAKAWVESRKRKKGPRVLKQELFQKGIAREIIDEIMNSESGVKGEETAKKLLEKKSQRWKSLKQMEFRKKAHGFLLRRGFEYGIVKDLVEKYIKKRYN